MKAVTNYPNLEDMCRLCLKENAGMVCIFNKEKHSDKYGALSIPIRIMSCVALEVHDFDDFPKKICTECRLQLEKSFYFRKLSQASDAKIRKHLRLLAMGKASQVFSKKADDDDDVLELQDSIDFIKEQEDQQKQAEKLKMESFMREMKLQNEIYLKKVKEDIKASCWEELIPVIREEMRKELRPELQKEIEENLRKDLTEQCMSEARETLLTEVREECRQLEIKCILDDLQIYLNNKKKILDTTVPANNIALKRSHSPVSEKVSTPKRKCIPENSTNIEVVRMEFGSCEDNANKENFEDIIENNQNTNDEDCESDGNFLIYDTEEGFDVKKKCVEDKFEYASNDVTEVEYEDNEYTDPNVTFEKINVENIDNNEEPDEITSTTSYRIEDNEDGEIQFLKKSDDINNANDKNSNPDNASEDLMVINITEGLDIEYVEQIEEEENEKHVKSKKQLSNKSKKSPGKKSNASTITTTTSSKTTSLTKTYVNPMQRSTDTPKMFKCDDCPMAVSTKSALERHLRSHRRVEKTGVLFQCPECRIVVSCSSALRRHMYVHYDEKPFSCTICKKSFVQKEILTRHMQTHTGERPHQCPHCERAFAQRINLTQHIERAHLDGPRIQQHNCPLCPKRFFHASGLSRHLASHGGISFQCSECNRNFGDRSAVKRHILSTHSDGDASFLKTDAESKISKIKDNDK